MTSKKNIIKQFAGKLSTLSIHIIDDIYMSRGTCEDCAFAQLVKGKLKCTRGVPDIDKDSFCDKFTTEVVE